MNWDAIPELLAVRQQWLVWKFEAKPGQTKPAKMPYYVGGGRRTGDQGSDKDRARLATLAVARQAVERGGWDGVGFAFLPRDSGAGGLLGIDLDKVIDPDTGEISERASSIIQACASYTEYSPSGTGVHIICSGDVDNFKSNDIGVEVFGQSQFFTFTARRYPGTPEGVTAIDPKVVRRLLATVEAAKQARKAGGRPAPAGGQDAGTAGAGASALPAAAALRARAESALEAIAPDCGYNDWISIGWALRSAFGDFGFGLWNAWSARSDKYQGEADLQSHWRSFDAGTADADKALGVVFKRAMEAGWKPPRPALASVQRQKPPRAKEPATAGGGDSGGAQPSEDRDDGGGDGGGGGDDDGGGGDDATADALLRARGRPLDCRENVLYALKLDPALQGVVRLNEFNRLLERARRTPWGREPGEWDEEDDMMLGEYLASRYRLLVKALGSLRNGVWMAARLNKYNPVVDRIRAQVWDGIDRLDHWLVDVFGVADRPYVRLIGKFFFMGLVQRALHPGCKFDYMLILKGEQGLQKSGAFRLIAAPWFTDNGIRVGDKDSIMAQQLAWLVESAELESLSKAESTLVKQHLSSPEDWYRPPYGSQMVRAPRHFVMVGTTNAESFLKDATGDRRFWPLEVQDVRLDLLAPIVPQLLAEAAHRLQAGERYWPTRDEERDYIFPEHEPFKVGDPWEDWLEKYVNRQTLSAKDDAFMQVKPNAERDFFSRQELYEKALELRADRLDGAGNSERRLTHCMRMLNFEPHRESTGSRRRGFKRLPVQATPQRSREIGPQGPSGKPQGPGDDNAEALDAAF